jgi:hypothetical protein
MNVDSAAIQIMRTDVDRHHNVALDIKDNARAAQKRNFIDRRDTAR